MKERGIWLNGASSSGKSTLAFALQEALSDNHLIASVDRWTGMLPERSFVSKDVFVRDLEPVVHGFHRSLVALLDAGNSLIVDHVLRNPKWLAECIQLLAGYSVLFVGVHCPIEVLNERERERGDRDPGLAGRHLRTVHSHGAYDVEVDTSTLSVNECVERILEAYASPPRPSAFEQLLGTHEGV